MAVQTGAPAPPHIRGWLATLPKERRRSVAEIAKAVDMNRESLRQRLLGDAWFRFAEARAIATYFGEPYATLFPGNSGIDPQDIETVRIAREVGAA